MSRGARVRQAVVMATTAMAVDQPELTYGEIHRRIRLGHKPPLPQDDWFRKTVAAARKNRDPDLDAPWSMAAFVTSPAFRAEVPHAYDATGDLLALWRMTLLAGAPFTVRHAIWVVRLRAALTDFELMWLYDNARQYSARERAGFDKLGSGDLDAGIAFERTGGYLSFWLHKSAIGAGLVPPRHRDHLWSEKPTSRDNHVLLPPSVTLENRLYVEALFELGRMDYFEKHKDEKDAHWSTELAREAMEVQSRKKEDPDSVIEIASSVYTMWLRRAASTQRWHELTLGERQGFFQQLSRAVRQQADQLNLRWKQIEIEGWTRETLDHFDEWDDWTPIDVYKRFSIPIQEHGEKEKEQTS